jgi:hypothetical protein
MKPLLNEYNPINDDRFAIPTQLARLELGRNKAQPAAIRTIRKAIEE